MATTSSKAVSAIDTGILLEAGTNEVEILIFYVAGQRYGVNVAKVREVLPIEKVTSLPESHPSVEGMVTIREDVVMLVDLAHYLYGDDNDQQGGERAESMLLLEFNKLMLAFRVSEVDRIVRASWSQSSPLPEVAGETAPVTSVMMLGEQLLQMIDFESISTVIGLQTAQVDAEKTFDTAAVDLMAMPIVVAEDSQLIRRIILDHLHSAGYGNIVEFSNGHEAWEFLEQKSRESSGEEELRQHVGLVITDSEMPRVDGLNLIRRIRDNAVLRDLPIILYSSLVSRSNSKKGNQVGADEQIAKPAYELLLSTLARLLNEHYGAEE